MDGLPSELVIEIALHAAFPDAMSLARVCQATHGAVAASRARLTRALVPAELIASRLPAWLCAGEYSLKHLLSCPRITHIRRLQGPLFWGRRVPGREQDDARESDERIVGEDLIRFLQHSPELEILLIYNTDVDRGTGHLLLSTLIEYCPKLMFLYTEFAAFTKHEVVSFLAKAPMLQEIALANFHHWTSTHEPKIPDERMWTRVKASRFDLVHIMPDKTWPVPASTIRGRPVNWVPFTEEECAVKRKPRVVWSSSWSRNDRYGDRDDEWDYDDRNERDYYIDY